MNFWQELHARKAAFDKELEGARNAIAAAGGIRDSVEVDGYGQWTCRHIPKGQRAHEKVAARTSAQLIERLTEARKPNAAKGGST